MPHPTKGEDKKSFIARFMESSEARSDFPDDKQRLAVAYSMFEKRNSVDHPWPKKYSCTFIEPGVVFYQDLGACSVCNLARTCSGDGSSCKTEGETVLVKQEALARLAPTFVGKPVIDKMHKDVVPSTVADGDADGVVTRVWLDDKSGWWMCEFLVWNPEAQKHCESSAYSVSCAYEPTEVEGGGSYHNLDYHEEIVNGHYTHLAIVTNPRYESARIFVNSSGKGEKMDWKFWQKGARKNAAPLDPKTLVNVDDEMVSLDNLLAAAKEDAPAKPELSDDTVLEHEGKEMTLADLKNSYRNAKAKKNAADDKCPACSGSGKKAPAENAGEGADGKKESLGEPPHMPDLRDPDPKKNDQAEDSAKKAEAAAKEKEALELKQAADDKAKAEADASKAAAEEKKNADDAAAKAEADAKEEKRNAGRASFLALKNAAGDRNGDAVKINIESVDDRLARGSAKYGSTR